MRRNSRNLKSIKLGAGGRLGAMLFAAVFALGFGAGGIWGGLLPLYDTFRAKVAVQGWHQVPAQILESQLSSRRSDDSTVYRADIRYQYTFNGQSYESRRVGLATVMGSDNIGDWHQQWVSRAERARSQGQSLTAWVDPQSPGQALLDPDIRWPKMALHLPFAIVFTGVGLGAGWVFFSLAARRDEKLVAAAGARSVQPSAKKSSASKQLAGAWIMAVFWCGLSFPVAAVFWMTGAPWLVRLMLLGFVAIGIGLLVFAFRQTRKARRYSAANFLLDPASPKAGQRFEVSLSTPVEEEGAALTTGLKPMKMRLSHWRVNDAGSGTSQRRVETMEAEAAGIPDMQGSIRWMAHFELPEDAPTFGARRSGERVEWRLELLKQDGSLDVSFDVPVEGSASVAHQPDRFAENLDFRTEHALDASESGFATEASRPSMPPQVSVAEMPDEWVLKFRQKPWRIAALVSLVPLATLLVIWWNQVPAQADAWDFYLRWPAFWAAVVWLFTLHAATRSWALGVTDQSLVVRRGSWVWRRKDVLPAEAAERMFFKLLFSSGGNASHPRKNYFGLYARPKEGAKPVLLTTGLPEKAGAEAVGEAIRRAKAHREGRFSPGAEPDNAASARGAGWGLILWAAFLAALYLARSQWTGLF
ncbi:DUF3592 domain-containing protein [Hydrogenophaga sp. 5NK40-0174]|uniref:DUF3592 domain-containing protein n=1 Tax=Hydrogenophaga sp. 5NK40-0174 TaxID=3127649 RepID=UPI003341A7D5